MPGKASSSTEAQVRDYYTGQVRQEWRRLDRNAYRRVELQTSLHFLEKHLPPQGLVLDAGGGPGRYTIELAKRGYQVVLLDVTPGNLEFARRQIKRAGVQDRVVGIAEGSIVDLSRFADNTFDATLCLGGPLSHVLSARQRNKAISELIRVTRNGAPLFVSVIGRLGLLVYELTDAQYEIEMPLFTQIRDTGDYRGGHGFTACHFFLREELRAAFHDQGVTVVEMAGLEGIGTGQRQKVNLLAKNEKRWQVWLETHYRTCTHPAAVGISEHMLLICRKT